MKQWLPISEEPICLAALKAYVARLQAAGVLVATVSDVEPDPDWATDRGVWLCWDGDRRARESCAEEELWDEEESPESDEGETTVAYCVRETYGRTLRWLAQHPPAAEWWLMRGRQTASLPK